MEFKRGANKVRKAMWWKDLKLKIIIGSVILLILLVIIRKEIFFVVLSCLQWQSC